MAISTLHAVWGVLIPAAFAFLPTEWRSLGEGVIHYLGAIRLTIGFFWGIRTREPFK